MIMMTLVSISSHHFPLDVTGRAGGLLDLDVKVTENNNAKIISADKYIFLCLTHLSCIQGFQLR